MVGAEAVATLSNRVSQINIQTQFIDDDNVWPSDQPKCFSPLLLIHHQGHHTPEQVTAMAELMYTGDIHKVASVTGGQSTIKHPKLDNHEKFRVLDMSMTTKEIKEILTLLEKNDESGFILIEGAPGIGKSVLSKEIAYRWGKKKLL